MTILKTFKTSKTIESTMILFIIIALFLCFIIFIGHEYFIERKAPRTRSSEPRETVVKISNGDTLTFMPARHAHNGLLGMGTYVTKNIVQLPAPLPVQTSSPNACDTVSSSLTAMTNNRNILGVLNKQDRWVQSGVYANRASYVTVPVGTVLVYEIKNYFRSTQDISRIRVHAQGPVLGVTTFTKPAEIRGDLLYIWTLGGSVGFGNWSGNREEQGSHAVILRNIDNGNLWYFFIVLT